MMYHLELESSNCNIIDRACSCMLGTSSTSLDEIGRNVIILLNFQMSTLIE